MSTADLWGFNEFMGFNPCQLLIYGVLINLWGFNPCQLLIYRVLMNLWGFNPCQLLIWNYLPMTDNF